MYRVFIDQLHCYRKPIVIIKVLKIHPIPTTFITCVKKSYDFVSESVTTLSGFSSTGGPLCK